MEKQTISGLTTLEAKNRLEQYGKNIVSSGHTDSLLRIFFSQFPSLINAILLLASAFSLFIGNFLDGIFILTVIVINAALGFIQEYRAARSMEKLKDYTNPTARVIRDSKEQEILAENLVPEDIVILSEGSRVPADGDLFDAQHLEIDESILTGESLPVMKNTKDNIYLGSLVTKGKGHFKVTRTGMQTRFGQIAHTLETITEDKTPLQTNLDNLGKFLSFAAITIGLLVIPIGLFYGRSLAPLFLVAVSIAISAIPESLPAVITIAFAVGVRRMARYGAIVRKMAAVETLGSVQIILSDKTGTITQNLMRVKKYWLTDNSKLPLVIKSCLLGNTASLVEKGSGRDYEIAGDQTDGALLIWIKGLTDGQTQQNIGIVADEYVFDPEYKTITTVWKEKSKKYVFVRGAPEAVLAKSNLTKEKKKVVTDKFEEFAGDGLRIIAFASKIESHDGKLSREHLEKGLTFLGFVGIYDPPRIEVKEANQKSRAAGIQVIMVTGDNELTALSLAREVGLITKDEDVLTGDELAKLTDDELAAIILKTRVFARTQPEDKLRLVSVLKKQGIVVGITGDGVNDTLALKKADVGVAMGEGGTDVAKDAADIVLTDNNFATLIKAIEEGRVIYQNITNVIVYLVAGNLAELSLVFFAALLRLPFVLLPTQILWINLVTDSLPALALATGSRDTTVLHKKPRDPKEALLNSKRLLISCLIGFTLAGILLVIFTILLQWDSEAHARGVIFSLMVYFQLLIAMAIGRHSLRKGNIFLLFTIVLIFILQVLISTTPFFQPIFHLTP